MVENESVWSVGAWRDDEDEETCDGRGLDPSWSSSSRATTLTFGGEGDESNGGMGLRSENNLRGVCSPKGRLEGSAKGGVPSIFGESEVEVEEEEGGKVGG